MNHSNNLCKALISILMIDIICSNAFCINQKNQQEQPLITTTNFYFQYLGTYEDSCSSQRPCAVSQGLNCINDSCTCSDNLYILCCFVWIQILKVYFFSPLWSNWELQCVKCDPGWIYLNYRCILPIQNTPVLYDDAKTYCSSYDSSILEFYDDVDLNSCMDATAPHNGFYVS
jgi:hypothetical protein